MPLPVRANLEARLLRVDLAFADDGTGYTITITTSPLF